MSSSRHNPAKREHLALHLATGGSVAAFSRSQEVPVRTCYLWTKEAGFTAKVSDYRAAIIDRLVGSLAKLGKSAVKEIGILSKTAATEHVRLAANRAILADLISVGTYSSQAKQLAAMEARLDSLERSTGNALPDT